MARRLFLGALALVGLPVILVVAALGAANTDWGRAWIVDTVESATAGGPVRVGIDALGGSLPGRVVLEGVRLADAAGRGNRGVSLDGAGAGGDGRAGAGDGRAAP